MYIYLIAISVITTEAFRLRSKDITQISLSSTNTTSTSSSGGFTVSTLPPIIGNAAPTVPTTPAPYQLYVPVFDQAYQIGWTIDPSAYKFDTTNVNKLNVNQMGNNFRIMNTASPQVPVLNE